MVSEFIMHGARDAVAEGWTHIDETIGPVRIFELEYRPSEVLYAVDLEAYRDLWLAFDPVEAPEDSEPSDEGEERSE